MPDEIAPNIPALQVRLVPAAELIGYARNSRRHAPEQVDAIAASIREFGWTVPCLIDGNNGLIAGHGRLEAAKLLGIKQIPCIDLAHLTETQKRALVIADNQIPMHRGATWDLDMLRMEVSELKFEGFDVGLLGFADELTDLIDPDLANPEDRDPDEAPPVPPVPHSKSGDVWILGPHRIICGDSTLGATWEALLGTEKAHLVMTDPPFGVSYQAIANDDLTGEKLREFLLKCNRCLFDRLLPGASVYMFHADSEGLSFRAALLDAGFKVSQCLTWVKDSLVLGRSRYQWRHEPCLLADKPGGKQRWWGGRKQTTVVEMGEGGPFQRQADGRYAITIGDEVLVVSGDAVVESAPGSIIRHPKPKRSEHHPTQKPVAMLERLMKNSARSGDLVLEPFSGSGSTLMAAERLGLYCRASELDPGYVDVAVMRWQGYTGRQAVHAVSGANFPVSPAECVAF